MYQHYLAFASAHPTGGKMPIEAIVNAMQTLYPETFVVLEGPTIVQDTDEEGNPKFQNSGEPVYKSLEDQFLPISKFSLDNLEVHSDAKIREDETEASELGAGISNAMNQVFNPYLSLASINKQRDFENDQAERKGKLTEIKPLENNPPRKLVICTDGEPHLLVAVTKLSSYVKSMLQNNPFCGDSDLQVILLVFSNDPSVRAVYSDLNHGDNLIEGLTLVDESVENADYLTVILSNLLVE